MVEDEDGDVRTVDAEEGEEDGVTRDVKEVQVIMDGLIVIVMIVRDAMIAVMLVITVEDFHRKHPILPNPHPRIVLDG